MRYRLLYTVMPNPLPPLTTLPFKKAMDDLDARCLCLGDGQEGRDRASVTRRLVLPAPHASLVVRLDPADPRGVSSGSGWWRESV